ncbi:MAG: transposase [Candidatus Omnitrophota bacterium]|nr:MAG: transposase [Candidatus Omnitrophota bacterium]
MRKVHFANDYYYHTYNRGVDKRKIFLNKIHYFRFIHSLFEFNDLTAAINFGWKMKKDYRGLASIMETEEKERLVDIVCFCLMPNHFHLILKQVSDNGIVKFMQKLGTGYTMYFNQVCQRKGSLFEGPFKAILIEKDEYFVHLSRYIHLNPVELISSDWRKKGIKDWNKINKFLEQYRWSSYLDYIGKSNFPSLSNRGFLLDYFKGKESYQAFVASWLKEDMEKIEDSIGAYY